MRFHLSSFDLWPRPTVEYPFGRCSSYAIEHQSLDTDAIRYNQALVLAAARYLHAHGHDVSSDTRTPDPFNAEGVGCVTVDGITTSGVYNSDVVIIHEVDSGTFCILDMQDYPSFSRELSASPNCLAVYMTMYEREWVYANTAAPKKFRPFVYFSMFPDLTAQIAQDAEFSHRIPTDPRLFFAGTIGSVETNTYVYHNSEVQETRPWREVALYLQELAPNDVVIWSRDAKLPRRAWWSAAAKHRWNLFLPGGPWCNREHELWTLGCATIGFEYPRHPLMIPLRPDVHYAAVTSPHGTDGVGRPKHPKKAAQVILAKYYDIRENASLASTIASSAYIRMHLDATPERVIRQILRECWNI